MKKCTCGATALSTGIVLAVSALGSAQAVDLPAGAAYPTNTASNPGFQVTTAQAPMDYVAGNSYVRALKQLDGTLRDDSNNLVANVAIAGTNPGGVYYTDVVSFEKDAAGVYIQDADGNPLGYLVADYFPGIPGTEGETTQFALEAVGLIPLEAGTHTLGISASADRTDVNDDDGYAVYVGANPRDYFSTKIAEFSRGNAKPFTSNQQVENIITVTAPVTGLYPFRIVYWQTGRGATLSLYEIDTNTTQRTLINDPNDTSSLRAYRSTTGARFNSPYVAEISPVPDSAGNSASAPIEVTLFDGFGATLNTNTIQFWLNGVSKTPQVTKDGSRISLEFSPDVTRTDANNAVKLVFADSNGVLYTNQWAFTIITEGGSANPVKGQWDFDFGDLRASVGTALRYLDPTYDGASGSSSDKTTFGTCTSLGVPLIKGQEAVVMRVPGELTRKIGYVMEHGIAPNGGGSRVNQFTIIMDVYVETSGAGAASLLQMDQDNTSDGDLFWQGNNFGQGTGGYNGKGTFTAGEWHRVSAAYDMAASTPVVTKFVDGIKQDDWTAGHSLDGVRRSLAPTAVLFGDGDQDERRAMYVNSIQIRAGKLSDAELYALGGPSAAGVPAEIPKSTVTGQWDFNYGDLSASIGKALNYLDPTFDGPTGASENKTAFGLASVLGVAAIGTNDPAIMQVPGDLTRQIGYLMEHGIAPNGGGSRVNQFTLIMDVMVDTSGAGAASLLQMDSDNTSDGDLFWQGNNFGQGTGGYNGLGTFTAGEWHRVAAAYDMAASTPVVTKYVDGIFQDDWITGHSLDGARRSLGTVAVLFGDGDQDERRQMWVDSIQIRAGALSKAELESLGAPTGLGIPVVLSAAAAPTLGYGKLGNQLIFWWPLDATGYVLESSPSLSNPTWTAVTTTTVNSGVVSVGAGNLYFRLKK
jgi:hypothetical protein